MLGKFEAMASASVASDKDETYLQKNMSKKTTKPRRLTKHNSREMQPMSVFDGPLVKGGWLKTPFCLPTKQYHNVTFAPVTATTPWLQQALVGSCRGVGPVLKIATKAIKAEAEQR